MSMLPVTRAEASTAGQGNPVAPWTNTIVPKGLGTNDQDTIAEWFYNPWCENAKYYARGTFGGTPASFGDNNSTTILLTDENGYGIICPNQEVFITSCDFWTQNVPAQGNTGAYLKTFMYPRYFKLYFRQRYIRSPLVLQDIFEDYALGQVQGYQGQSNNILEVSLITGDPHRDRGPEGLLNPSGMRTTYALTNDTSATADAVMNVHPNILSRGPPPTPPPAKKQKQK